MQGGFHQILSRELGVTPVRATLRAGKYGVYYPAKYTIKAARWAAPYAKEYGAKAVDWVRTGIRERIARSGDRMSFDKSSTA